MKITRIENFLNTVVRTDRTEGNGEGVFNILESRGPLRVSTRLCHLQVDTDTLISKGGIDMSYLN